MHAKSESIAGNCTIHIGVMQTVPALILASSGAISKDICIWTRMDVSQIVPEVRLKCRFKIVHLNSHDCVKVGLKKFWWTSEAKFRHAY